MAKADLILHFDDERTEFRPGDVVRGQVEVRTDEEVQCNGLQVELLWHTHGKGNSHREVVQGESLFTGVWQPGRTSRYPFSLVVPPGPSTYHGHYLNVAWQVRARADVPWAFDPKVEHELTVRPSPDAEPEWHALFSAPSYAPEPIREEAKAAEQQTNPVQAAATEHFWRRAFAIGCGGALLIIVLVLLGVSLPAIFALARGDFALGTHGPLLLVPLVFVTLIAVVAARLLRNRVASSKLGEVRLEVSPRKLRPGDEVSVRLFSTPSKSGRLSRVVAELRACETVVRGSGTSKKTFRHEVFSETVEISSGIAFYPRHPLQAEGTMRIPTDAPPSFAAPANQLTWTVVVCIEIPRWPDWQKSSELVVHP